MKVYRQFKDGRREVKKLEVSETLQSVMKGNTAQDAEIFSIINHLFMWQGFTEHQPHARHSSGPRRYTGGNWRKPLPGGADLLVGGGSQYIETDKGCR